MKLKHWLAAAACAVSLAAFGTGAQAGPVGGMDIARVAGQPASGVEQVRWVRYCDWEFGYRHCRRYWQDYGYYSQPYAYYYRPYAYYNPYYYGSGFGFYYGGGHRHYHRYHRHHRHHRHRHHRHW